MFSYTIHVQTSTWVLQIRPIHSFLICPNFSISDVTILEYCTSIWNSFSYVFFVCFALLPFLFTLQPQCSLQNAYLSRSFACFKTFSSFILYLRRNPNSFTILYPLTFTLKLKWSSFQSTEWCSSSAPTLLCNQTFVQAVPLRNSFQTSPHPC